MFSYYWKNNKYHTIKFFKCNEITSIGELSSSTHTYRRFSRINERKRQYTLIVHNNYSINRALFKSIGIESKLEFIALHRKIGNNL